MSLLDTFPELATASRSPHVALTASPSLIEAAPGALGFGEHLPLPNVLLLLLYSVTLLLLYNVMLLSFLTVVPVDPLEHAGGCKI